MFRSAQWEFARGLKAFKLSSLNFTSGAIIQMNFRRTKSENICAPLKGILGFNEWRR